MKLNVFIGLLILMSINVFAQDSIARLRKPVLLYLLEQERVAVYYQEESNRLLVVIGKMKMKEVEYLSIIENLKKDSAYSSAQIEIQKVSAQSWKETYEAEVVAHKKTKQKARRDKIIIFTVCLAIILLK